MPERMCSGEEYDLDFIILLFSMKILNVENNAKYICIHVSLKY